MGKKERRKQRRREAERQAAEKKQQHTELIGKQLVVLLILMATVGALLTQHPRLGSLGNVLVIASSLLLCTMFVIYIAKGGKVEAGDYSSDIDLSSNGSSHSSGGFGSASGGGGSSSGGGAGRGR